ncbi:MAG TPA: histidine kinase dimerization/phosphoacceptor domain -containing protein [Methanomicrobiales archaeon]|nr:histidine kinase dimerization/phosphoacceptor domain -containing protein [Methanomicrobiales archaeon]
MTRSTPRERETAPGDDAITGGLLDLLPDGLLLIDGSGKIVHLNSAMEQVSGMRAEESRGMTARDFIAKGIARYLAGDEGGIRRLTGILSTGGEGKGIEFALSGPKGVRWFSYITLPLRDAPYQGGRLDTYREVTGNRRAGQARSDQEDRLLAIFLRAMKMSLSRDRELTERERRLSAIFEAAQNVAFVTSDLRGKESRILDFSPGAEGIFMYWKGDIVGEKLALLYPPEELELLAEIHRKMKRKQVEYSGEITLVRKNGEQFPALLNMYPLRDEAGKVKAAVSVCIDITILKRAEAQIRATLLEKENLLREIHHRVKNNMQVVSALLILQSKKTKDPRILEMFRESEHRIKTMALIHEKLYQSRSFGTIDLAEYLTRLLQYLFRSYEERSKGVSLQMDVRDISLDLDTALPVSLIMNELVSNSLKYAFPGEKGGKICIRVAREEGKGFVMEIRDDGIGLPPGFNLEETGTLGLHLVHGLAVSQLGGSIELGKGKGTSFIIRFPDMKK